MKKRLIAAFLTGCMIFSICGCNAATNVPAQSDEGGTDASVAAVEEAATDAAVTVAEEGAADESVMAAEEAESESPVIDDGDPWIASNLKENVVNSEKPSVKDDFNRAVNYDWVCSTDIPEGYVAYSTLTQTGDIVKDKIIATLEDDSIEGHDAELVRGLYKAYLDWDKRNETGLSELESIIKDIESLSDLSAVSEFICDFDRSFFSPAMLTIANMPDLLDSNKYVAAVEHVPFILSDSAEYKSRTNYGQLTYDADKKLFISLMGRMGYAKEAAEKLFDDCMTFETSFAEKSYSTAETHDPDYFSKITNYYDFDELAGLSPNYPLKEFIESSGYGNAEKFLVLEPESITRVSELYTDENLEMIKGYLIVQTVMNCASTKCVLDKEATDLAIEAQNAISGSQGTLSDKDYAYRIVNGVLAEPLAKAYIIKYDPSEKKEVITGVCRNVVDVCREMLEAEDWLSDETKELALEKLDNIKIVVAEPIEYKDFSGLDTSGLGYFDMVKTIDKYIVELDKKNINGEVNKNLWSESPLETNAFYNPQNNSINIQLGILDGDAYNDNMSKEELYGAIGPIIGHEISHAFDTNGAQFDKDGNYNNWWKEEDFEAFRARAQRLVDYYDRITVFGDEKVNGTMIQTEAIADMTGLEIMLLLASKEDNFDYKRFFESYANLWKKIGTYENISMLLTQDEHPLNYIRINTCVQQFDEFYETFDVKEGDGMYLAPEDRVLVW